MLLNAKKMFTKFQIYSFGCNDEYALGRNTDDESDPEYFPRVTGECNTCFGSKFPSALRGTEELNYFFTKNSKKCAQFKIESKKILNVS